MMSVNRLISASSLDAGFIQRLVTAEVSRFDLQERFRSKGKVVGVGVAGRCNGWRLLQNRVP